MQNAAALALALLSAGLSAQSPDFHRRHRMTPSSWFVDRVEVAELTGDLYPDLLLRLPGAFEVWAGGPDGRSTRSSAARGRSRGGLAQ